MLLRFFLMGVVFECRLPSLAEAGWSLVGWSACLGEVVVSKWGSLKIEVTDNWYK